MTSLSLFAFVHWRRKWQPTHSSVLAWRIPGTGKPGGLPSLGSHRVGHDWSDLAYFLAIGIKQCAEECVGERIYPALGNEEIPRRYNAWFGEKCTGQHEIKGVCHFLPFFFFFWWKFILNLLKPYDYWQRGDGGEGLWVNHYIPLGNSDLSSKVWCWKLLWSCVFLLSPLSLWTNIFLFSPPLSVIFSCSPWADWVLPVFSIVDDGLPIS